MKCPRCSEEMEEGYVWVASTYGAGLFYWSLVEPKGWFWRVPKEYVEILKRYWNDKKYWLRQGYRCEECGLIVFEEKYTLSNEEGKTEKKDR
ncbi:MAG: PF20097 family protein [Candidatus Bathyarchaeia archaeon]